MYKHHFKYEEKCTRVTQFQGQMYTIYLQAYMMCSCKKMMNLPRMGAMWRNELYDTNIHNYQIVQFRIGHFTVIGGSEAGSDLVLVQTSCFITKINLFLR